MAVAFGTEVFNRLLAVFEQRIFTDQSHLNTEQRRVRQFCTAGSKLTFCLLRKRITDTCPEKLFRAVENDRRINEAVLRTTLRKVVMIKGAVVLIDHCNS